ncbi:MAG: chemotaxis protein CheB [Cytophagaceae bacterium]
MFHSTGKKYEAIVIGGSLGGMEAVSGIIKGLPGDFNIPVIVVLHRLKNVKSSLIQLLSKYSALPVYEIEDKTEIKEGAVYVAPANYHTLIEKNRTFSLDCSEAINYCRPSIDVLFESATEQFGNRLIGIVLTGANNDGSKGLKAIAENGGVTIVQDPDTAESDVMPVSALKLVKADKILDIKGIQSFLIFLHDEIQKAK